jgi:hypothetical protein
MGCQLFRRYINEDGTCRMTNQNLSDIPQNLKISGRITGHLKTVTLMKHHGFDYF